MGKAAERQSYDWGLPQHLLQFPQELDGPSGCDVGPVEERQAAAVDGEGIVGEGVVCGAGTQSSAVKPTRYITKSPLCVALLSFSSFVVFFNSFVWSHWCILSVFNSAEVHSSKPAMSNVHTVLYIKYYAWRDFSLFLPSAWLLR